MADSFGPFDGVSWSQGQWFGVAKGWAPSGILAVPAAAVTAGAFAASSSGLSLTIAAAGNAAWVRGAGYVPDTNKTFAVPANTNATLSRRDRIVLRRDLVAKTVTVERLTGTPASSPAAPALTQSDTGTWEESICSFLVPPASGTTLSGFLDERRWIDPDGGRLADPAYGSTAASVSVNASAETRVTTATLNLQGMLIAGKAYQVCARSVLNSDAASASVTVNARAAVGAVTVAATDTVIGTWRDTMPTVTGSVGRRPVKIGDKFTTSVTGVHSFALFLTTSAGQLTLVPDARGITDFWIEPCGVARSGLVSI